MNSFFRSAVKWTRVRGLGRLTILTRASYIVLAIVPLMAWGWPAIEGSRIWIEETAKLPVLIQDSEIQADGAVRLRKTMPNAVKKSESMDSDKTLKRRTDGATPKKMPFAWTKVYLAALSIFLAHLIFEIACPVTIRNHDSLSYRSDRMSDFANHTRNTRFVHAIQTVNWWSGELEMLKAKESATKFETVQYERQKKVYELCQSKDALQNASESDQLEVVELSSIIEFHTLDHERFWSCLACACLYLIGIVLILITLVSQVATVVRAAF